MKNSTHLKGDPVLILMCAMSSSALAARSVVLFSPIVALTCVRYNPSPPLFPRSQCLQTVPPPSLPLSSSYCDHISPSPLIALILPMLLLLLILVQTPKT